MKMLAYESIQKRSRAMLFALAIMTSTAPLGHAAALSCLVDGYAAMGGMVCNTTNSYLLGGDPDSEPMGGMATWGYAWLKFDESHLLDEPVESAILQLQSISQTHGGMFTPPEDVPGGIDVSVYAVTADVATINSSTVDGFRSAIAASPANTITVTGGDGFYEWDITDLVRSWNADRTDPGSFSIVLIASEAIPKFYSMETTSGIAPVINVTAAVPEPGTILLVLTACGMLTASAILRKARRKTIGKAID